MQESWKGEEDNTSARVINKLLMRLKCLLHLENPRVVLGMLEQRHGLLASIPIELPFQHSQSYGDSGPLEKRP